MKTIIGLMLITVAIGFAQKIDVNFGEVTADVVSTDSLEADIIATDSIQTVLVTSDYGSITQLSADSLDLDHILLGVNLLGDSAYIDVDSSNTNHVAGVTTWSGVSAVVEGIQSLTTDTVQIDTILSIDDVTFSIDGGLILDLFAQGTQVLRIRYGSDQTQHWIASGDMVPGMFSQPYEEMIGHLPDDSTWTNGHYDEWWKWEYWDTHLKLYVEKGGAGSYSDVLVMEADSTGDFDFVYDLTAGTIEADNGVDEAAWVVQAGDTIEIVGGVIVDIAHP